jgi:hypothetical protein
MNLDEFTRATYKTDTFYRRPRIYCNDGFNFSVQGGDGKYSTPRRNEKEFMAMEIGFPSNREESILEFAEDRDNPTETVYGYVDNKLIQQVIDKHGGIDVDKTLYNFDKAEIVE